MEVGKRSSSFLGSEEELPGPVVVNTGLSEGFGNYGGLVELDSESEVD